MHLNQAHYIDATWPRLAKPASSSPGVVSGRQSGGAWFGGGGIESTDAQPGDTAGIASIKGAVQ